MNNLHAFIPLSDQPGPLEDMFAEIPDLEPFDVKKDELAAQLAALMVHCKMNRSMIAERLGWTKSRLTKVLSGKGNSTFKTIYEFSQELGYDLDVVYRTKHQKRCPQPWETTKNHIVNSEESISSAGYTVVVQSPQEIAESVQRGTAQALYISAVYKNATHASNDPPQVAWEEGNFYSGIFSNSNNFISI